MKYVVKAYLQFETFSIITFGQNITKTKWNINLPTSAKLFIAATCLLKLSWTKALNLSGSSAIIWHKKKLFVRKVYIEYKKSFCVRHPISIRSMTLKFYQFHKKCCKIVYRKSKFTLMLSKYEFSWYWLLLRMICAVVWHFVAFV